MSADLTEAREFAAQLERANVHPEKARTEAYAKFPGAAAAEQAERERNDRTREKEEQAVIVKMARAIGMTVRSTSQPRAAKVSPGIPDLILSHRGREFFGFWEAKRQVGGKRSTAQVEFGDDCLAANVAYGFGDRHAFAHFLAQHGFTPPMIPL